MSTAYLIKITAAVFAPLEAAALVLVCIWAYLNRPASIGLLWIGTCAVVAVLSVAFWGWITHGHPDPYRELDGVEADPVEHLKDLQQGVSLLLEYPIKMRLLGTLLFVGTLLCARVDVETEQQAAAEAAASPLQGGGAAAAEAGAATAGAAPAAPAKLDEGERLYSFLFRILDE